jgi:hypothetical protein
MQSRRRWFLYLELIGGAFEDLSSWAMVALIFLATPYAKLD